MLNTPGSQLWTDDNSATTATVTTERLQLPLLFVKLKHDSEVNIEMDENRESLILTANKKFKMMNENHLFENMGLTQTTEEELETLFS